MLLKCALFVVGISLTCSQFVNPFSSYSSHTHFEINYSIFEITQQQTTRKSTVEDGQIEATTRKPNYEYETSTQVDDRDYWDNDDFQPHRIDSRDHFDWKLLKEVIGKQNSNIIISPFSIKFALALLYEGAQSTTKQELAEVFLDKNSSHLIHETYKQMADSLKETGDGYKLNFGTKVYLAAGLLPKASYKTLVKQVYDTDIENLRYNRAQADADTINRWCNNVTEGHLTNLVSSNDIQNARLLLLNAIYFNGKWRTPFAQTFERAFNKQSTERIQTTFMSVTSEFYYFYSSRLQAKILRLPYTGKKFSMTIFLPDAKDGLNELINKIDGNELGRLIWHMKSQTIVVAMPKFKFEYKSQLKENLMALGINEIFSDDASLGNILNSSRLSKKLKVNDIIQKAGIEVDDKGTTAYAVTKITVINKIDSTEEFIADRPFMFIINDDSTTNIIFVGKVLDPSAI